MARFSFPSRPYRAGLPTYIYDVVDGPPSYGQKIGQIVWDGASQRWGFVLIGSVNPEMVNNIVPSAGSADANEIQNFVNGLASLAPAV